MLEELAAEVHAKGAVECPWELFRLQHWPGRDHEDAAAQAAMWADENDIHIDFDIRKREAGRGRLVDVIYVLFTPR